MDVLDGKPFGSAGPYERITGKIYFSVSVANTHNQAIVDLANAMNLQNGEVEFSADFVAIRPKDPSRGNGTLFLEDPNRGLPHILSLVDGGDEDLAHSAGDAWFRRRELYGPIRAGNGPSGPEVVLVHEDESGPFAGLCARALCRT